MTVHRRRAAVLLLLSASAFLPGCFFARTCIPMDPKGMEMPLGWAADTFEDQVARTSKLVSDLPADLDAHVESRWRDLTTFPGE